MNKTNFNQTGGFPLKTERLQELETAYKIFNAFGMLAGNLTIISGCELVGSTIGNGFVHINGELLEFKAASVIEGSTVIIIEEPVNRAFKNGVIKPVHTMRYATFGTADTSWLWTDFTRMDSLKSIQSRILPPGTNPQLYSGALGSIPAGWQLCDGTNGTPNLSGRFIVGYDPGDNDYNAIAKTGGSKAHQLTVSQLPKFTPTGTAAGPYTGPDISGGGGFDGSNANKFRERPFKANEIGGNQPHENRPPYYTLAYIIYKG